MREQQSRQSVWWTSVLIIAFSLFTGLRLQRQHAGMPLTDLSHLTLSAECLREGCDPYDAAALNQQRQAHPDGRPRVWAEAPVYPPSSLLVVLPFAAMGWPAGALAFDLLSGLAFTCGCLALVWRTGFAAAPWGVSPAVLILAISLLSHPFVFTLAFGNPALLTVSLAGLACVLLLTARANSGASHSAAAWLMLGIALALKPQLAAGVTLVLLLRKGSRGAAWKAIALGLLLLLVACLAFRLRLGSFAFLGQLRSNVRLSLLPGATSDFSPANDESFDFLNLQAACSRVPGVSRAAAGVLAWVTTIVLAGAAWMFAKRSQWAERSPWTVIALAATISLLPVYHRGYDRVIALLLAPAAAELGVWSRKAAWAYAGLGCLWIANDTLMEHRLRRWLFKPQNPVEELLICCVLLAGLWTARKMASRSGEVGSIAR